MEKSGCLFSVIAFVMAIFCAVCCIAGRTGTAKAAGNTTEIELPEMPIGESEKNDEIVFVFDNEDEYFGLFEGRVTDIQDVSYDAEKKCFVLSVGESTDPFIELLFGVYTETGRIDPISADKYKFIQFGVRFDTGAGREGQFYFQTTPNMDYKESQNLSYLYKGTDKLQYINIDASANGAWTGNVSDCRYDLLTTCKYDVEFEVYYVGFFENQEAANSYGDAWLQANGIDPGESEQGPQTGETEEVSSAPYDLILFDRRAGDNVNISLGEALFEAEMHSQIDSVYADSASNSLIIVIQGGNDPFIEMMFGALTDSIAAIPCAKYKVLQIALKTDVSLTGGTGTMYFQTDIFSGYGETKNVHYKYNSTNDIQFLNIDLGAHKLWEGNVANCRFDMFENAKKDTQMNMYYVAFFKDVQSAEEFSAKYLEWSEKGGDFPADYPVKATAAPTQEPTAAPDITAAPTGLSGEQATADNSGNGGKATDNSGKSVDSGNKFPVVPVVIGGVVAVAAAVVVAILLAKKKKH